MGSRKSQTADTSLSLIKFTGISIVVAVILLMTVISIQFMYEQHLLNDLSHFNTHNDIIIESIERKLVDNINQNISITNNDNTINNDNILSRKNNIDKHIVTPIKKM